jgi:hypothetical protein
MLKISRIRPCENNKSCSIHHNEPNKISFAFVWISTIFYTFYKFLQNWNSNEDEHLRRGPYKETGLCNWVPRPWEAAAPTKFQRAGRAPGRGGGVARAPAHLGRGGERGWREDGSGEGARRRPAVEPAAARAPERLRLQVNNKWTGGVNCYLGKVLGGSGCKGNDRRRGCSGGGGGDGGMEEGGGARGRRMGRFL